MVLGELLSVRKFSDGKIVFQDDKKQLTRYNFFGLKLCEKKKKLHAATF